MSHARIKFSPKFHRETDQRRALIKGLVTELFDHGKITTTHVRAKAIRPVAEKLITKAKKADLHNRRQVISNISTEEVARKLVDEIAPRLSERNSGYLRITRLNNRRGDNTPMSVISFVDDISGNTSAPVADKPKKAKESK